VAFKQGQFLGNIAVAINIDTGTSNQVIADPKGICYALCCIWMKEIKKNRSYMADLEKDIITASKMQEAYKSRCSYSDCDNDLVLQGLGTVVKKNSIPYSNPNVLKDALDDFAASDKANFALIGMTGTNEKGDWAHIFVAKLNRSSTGGWLNWSFPCALFDPNVGQGMYNNHADMAADIQKLILDYNATGVRGYTIQCESIN
jgi:hypothetical protein